MTKEENGPISEIGAASKDTNLSSSTVPSGLDFAIAGAASDWWTTGARLALRQLASTVRRFDADHLLSMVGDPTDPHYVGAAFAAAQRAGVIEVVGCRVAANGRLLRIWSGCR